MRHCPCTDVQQRQHFYTKTTSVKIYILYIDEAHMALDIVRLAVYFFMYSVSLGDALTTKPVRPFFSIKRQIEQN